MGALEPETIRFVVGTFYSYHGDYTTHTFFVEPDHDGLFKESNDVGRSVSADRRSKAKTKVKPGYGDQGDQPKRPTKKATAKKPHGSQPRRDERVSPRRNIDSL